MDTPMLNSVAFSHSPWSGQSPSPALSPVQVPKRTCPAIAQTPAIRNVHEVRPETKQSHLYQWAPFHFSFPPKADV